MFLASSLQCSYPMNFKKGDVMKSNYLQSIGLVALFVVLSACGGGSSEPLNVAGDYDLVAANGSTATDDCDAVFPTYVTITHDGKKIELFGDGEKLTGEVDDKGNFSATGNAFEGGGTVSCSGTIDPEKDVIQASCEVSAGNDKMSCEVSYGPDESATSSGNTDEPVDEPVKGVPTMLEAVPAYQTITAGSYKKGLDTFDTYNDDALCNSIIPSTINIAKPAEKEIRTELYGSSRILNYDQKFNDFYFVTVSQDNSTELWCSIRPAKYTSASGDKTPTIYVYCQYSYDDKSQANHDKSATCRSYKVKQ